ncbi:MAG: RagB/SusD family nutrient uptake outer membrane protein [Mucinivorans sp.]
MKIKILATLAAFLMLVGCNNKWLDGAQPQDGSLTEEIVFSSENGVQNALTGLYSMIRSYSPWAGEDNGGVHNVYGYRTQIAGFDVMGNDIVIYAPYGYFTGEAVWNAPVFNKTGTRSAVYWISFYKYINNANAIIKAINASKFADDYKKEIISEAKAIRAWSYFQLSRIYQATYAIAKDKPCVPIYTEPATAAETGKPRSSVADVYKFILEDLSDANIQAMPTTKVRNYSLNRYGAYAIRSQVKLQMEDWAGAQADANEAIGSNSANFPLMNTEEYLKGFNTLNREVIWGLDINQDQGNGIASFAAFAAADYATFPYFCFYINNDFQALFTSPTDVRTSQIVVNNKNPKNPNHFISLKFLSKFDFEMDDYLIRASEMVLIQAECFARLGADAEAQRMLFLLQSTRDPKAVQPTATGNALIENILVERRKELYGEIGVEYFDLYRLHRPLVRSGNHFDVRLFTVPSAETNPEMWMLQIPQQENQSNPNNSEKDNNPVRATPKP